MARANIGFKVQSYIQRFLQILRTRLGKYKRTKLNISDIRSLVNSVSGKTDKITIDLQISH